MAGGKETPRQKMIGMMYLVLTALLALNVSKQVIAAFVTLNNKLDTSARIIENNNLSTYDGFEKKILTLEAQGATEVAVGDVKKWQTVAFDVRKQTNEVVSFLLSECNEMIKVADGVDWIDEEARDEDGNITKLKALGGIQNFDNYDIPTNFFIGGDPQKPAERGLVLRQKVIDYRNSVATIMGTYTGQKGENYSFTPPSDMSGLDQALKNCNPDDTSFIASFMRALDIPERVTVNHDGHEEDLPWPSVMFDHAPIVAAAAMITAVKLDVKNAESIATDFFMGKVDVNEFDFDTIEPLAFSKSGYINQGDSLNLRVMIAAYKKSDIPKVMWGQDEDTSNTENWVPGNGERGSINVIGNAPGEHKIMGTIMVKQRGIEVPKPFDFTYTVGEPMGIVGLPEMRVLYRGYKNIVEGTASGFAADRVTLSGNGCSISKNGTTYIAKVGAGVREATISVNGRKDDGRSVNLGSFKFKVKALPTPLLYLGGISNGQTPGLSSVRAQGRVNCRYDESVPLTGVTFSISSGTVSVDGIMRKGRITSGGNLDANAKQILAQSAGKQVTIMVNYRGPDNVSKRTALVFTTR